MAEIDIYNNKPRPIRCISNKTGVWGGEGGESLEVGKIYHMTSLAVHGWHTEIFLEEMPEHNQVGFNSCLSEEE